MQTENIKIFWKTTLSQFKQNIKTLKYHERLDYKNIRKTLKYTITFDIWFLSYVDNVVFFVFHFVYYVRIRGYCLNRDRGYE